MVKVGVTDGILDLLKHVYWGDVIERWTTERCTFGYDIVNQHHGIGFVASIEKTYLCILNEK